MMRDRVTIIAGSLTVAGSIALAFVIHRPDVHCSYIGNVPPPGCISSDYSMTLRVGIVVAGFIVALLILIGGRVWSHRSHQ
jgi:hypothetical protein